MRSKHRCRNSGCRNSGCIPTVCRASARLASRLHYASPWLGATKTSRQFLGIAWTKFVPVWGLLYDVVCWLLVQECLRQCQEQIEESLRNSLTGSASSASDLQQQQLAASKHWSEASAAAAQPSVTPTDVRDVVVDGQWWCISQSLVYLSIRARTSPH